MRIYLQNDQRWLINNDYGPFGHHFLGCPEIKEGVTLRVGKPTGLYFTVIELSFKILSLYLSILNKLTKIVKIHEPYRVSIKNVPQFLLNFSGYKHARRLGHNSFERLGTKTFLYDIIAKILMPNAETFDVST